MTIRNFLGRILLFLGIILIGHLIIGTLEQTADPIVRTQLTVAAVNGGNAEMVNQRAYESFRSWLPSVIQIGYGLIFYFLFLSPFISRSWRIPTKNQN